MSFIRTPVDLTVKHRLLSVGFPSLTRLIAASEGPAMPMADNGGQALIGARCRSARWLRFVVVAAIRYTASSAKSTLS
jgi:hypothetical protein